MLVLQKIVMYGALVAIPIAGYLGYDYGMAKALEREQAATEKVEEKSTTLAEASETVRGEREEKGREIIREIEKVVDETKCLDVAPPAGIRDGVRKQQRDEHSARPTTVGELPSPHAGFGSGDDDKS